MVAISRDLGPIFCTGTCPCIPSAPSFKIRNLQAVIKPRQLQVLGSHILVSASYIPKPPRITYHATTSFISLLTQKFPLKTSTTNPPSTSHLPSPTLHLQGIGQTFQLILGQGPENHDFPQGTHLATCRWCRRRCWEFHPKAPCHQRPWPVSWTANADEPGGARFC